MKNLQFHPNFVDLPFQSSKILRSIGTEKTRISTFRVAFDLFALEQNKGLSRFGSTEAENKATNIFTQLDKCDAKALCANSHSKLGDNVFMDCKI